jgi:hypothetical protein|tara:strand:- start:4280 stop:4813 length:534 start_codon:yes stop_codon:yes gene_type:complete
MIIIDDFLPKDSLALQTITDDSLWETCLPYKWIGTEEAASDVWQQMSVHIWGEISKFGILPDKFAGVEYWSNAMALGGSKTDLPWHYDKDEQLYNGGKGELKTPFIGSVYYAHKEIPDGGFLEIDREGDVERIQPVPNRLIIFDSATVHRVVPITSGLRRTFATNVWIDKPKEENFK